MSLVTITNENFEDVVLNASEPVMVDFWAPWCGPCRMVSPLMDELAVDYTGKAKVGKINIDEQMSLAEKHNVMTIPTVMVFKNGQMVDKAVGARSKDDFSDMIAKQL